MEPTTITTIIDKHLQNWIDQGLNALPDEIEPEMANVDEPMDEEGWQKWYPIKSTVTDAEIGEVEQELNHKLPDSYKAFLKHRHFYELNISDARFSGQELKNWKRHLVDMAFNGYPREFLIDKGYIPFADWSDWGVLCFDTNIVAANNEYPVIRWDHDGDTVEHFSENFNALIIKLDEMSKNQ